MKKHVGRIILLTGVILSLILGFEKFNRLFTSQSPQLRVEQVHLDSLFQAYGVQGTFVWYDMKDQLTTVYNAPRASEPFCPASTFKIPNSMIALENGILANESQVLPWDGLVRQVSSWNQDHNLRSAIKNSAVWFYQELARQIGTDRYKDWLTKLHYGNQQIGPQIDQFWLDNSLQISAMQQIDFLTAFYQESLPFSKETFRIVKDILVLEETPQYIWRGKSGWALTKPHQVGWHVGYVEVGQKVYFYAMNIDIMHANEAKVRAAMVKDVIDLVK
jgi:beta-lactamase class D